jgi:hypothetical protein
LIGCAALLLAVSALLGVLNTHRTRELRARLFQTESSREAEQRLRASHEKELQGREAAVAAANAQFAETRTKIALTEAELTRVQTEKNDLEAKLRTNETEVAQLQKRIDDAEGKPDASGAPAATAELRAQLEEAMTQLQAAEREKTLLSDKIKAAEERSTHLEKEANRRPAAGGNPGIRGTVLAVNRAYNFVVLNLGGRQGVEANTEMLVLRGGSFIGKIRISSVEPATAIGDIITSSLARGVQVQPGDTVIYAGTNF